MKRNLYIIFLIIYFWVLSLPAAIAQTGINATYANDYVTIRGIDFTPGADYTVRVVDRVNSSLKAMKSATADDNGSIYLKINTGAPAIPGDHDVRVNRQDGTLAAGSVLRRNQKFPPYRILPLSLQIRRLQQVQP